MLRVLIIIGLILGFHLVEAQVYISSSSEISFYSETPIEDIEATNTRSSSLLNTKDKKLVFQIPIKAFKFEKNLMEEHFNENYLESDKYPKASFNGYIMDNVDLSKDGSYDVSATGKLIIHGVEKERTLKGTITVKGDVISLEGNFTIVLADHKIRIPRVVMTKIAEEVEVRVKVTYKPYVKKK